MLDLPRELLRRATESIGAAMIGTVTNDGCRRIPGTRMASRTARRARVRAHRFARPRAELRHRHVRLESDRPIARRAVRLRRRCAARRCSPSPPPISTGSRSPIGVSLPVLPDTHGYTTNCASARDAEGTSTRRPIEDFCRERRAPVVLREVVNLRHDAVELDLELVASVQHPPSVLAQTFEVIDRLVQL